MRTKILTIVISFIFLFTIYADVLYAVTDETIKVDHEVEENLEIETEEEKETEEKEEIVEVESNSEVQDIMEEDNVEEIIELQGDEQAIPMSIEQEDTVVTYEGQVYIETPKYQQSFTRPDSTKISVEGWAVSNDVNATLRILLDGNEVLNNVARTTDRRDIDTSVSPQYGGVKNTPNAGYKGTIDISQLEIGNHKLKVEEISRYGELINSYETVIQIQNRKYQGRVHIETPKNQQSFTRPDSTKISVEGWAVSNDVNATLRILLDGNEVLNNVARTTDRRDIDTSVSPQYGGVKNTPNAGYRGTIDISQLEAGNHKLRVEEISRYGELINSYETVIQVQNKKYQGQVYIETPKVQQSFTRPDSTKINVEGWAVSNDTNAVLRILLDGNEVLNNVARTTDRRDIDTSVSPQYGGVKNTPNAGYRGAIDISQVGAGNHKLKVEEFSRYGELINSYETVIKIQNKKYQGQVYIETPKAQQSFTRPDNTRINIEGWAVSNDTNAVLRILLDGNEVLNNVARTTDRRDIDTSVSPQYGGVKNTPNAGYRGTINISQLGAGNHKLKVEEISRYGELINSYETVIQVQNRKYQGRVYIETPKSQQSFIRPDTTKINVEGWAVSNDANAVLRILLDGNVILNNVTRTTERRDIDTSVSPQYGGVKNTPNAGYRGTIDISQIEAGNHKLKVEEISRYGELINSYEIVIKIQNKKYQGEMCVDMPTYNQSYNVGENMAVGGWAVSQDEFATVEIYIDNSLKTKADRYVRTDVAFYVNKYDGKTIHAGFGKLINTANLSVGTHKLTVYEKSRYGDVIGGVETQFVIKKVENRNSGNTNENTVTQTNNPIVSNTSGTKGIDVSQFQGNMDWKEVASSEMKFAMIRIGYRGYGTGGFAEDTKFKTNFSNAVANGLKVGVYFYSTAINTAEAKEDADYVVNILKKYGYQNKLSMPIAIDLELVSGVNTRDKNVSKQMRTNIANTFCSTISNYGYTPMIYACTSFLNNNMDTAQIPYDIWVAQYNSKCTYKGKYTIWQYTSSGKVSGISGNVDCNICYKNY